MDTLKTQNISRKSLAYVNETFKDSIFSMYYLLKPFILLIILIAVVSLMFIWIPFNAPEWRSLYLITIIVASWILNYLDIVVVSMLPLILSVFLVLMPLEQVWDSYITSTTLLYVTASMVGGAFQKVGLDKRFALFMMRGSSHMLYDISWRYAIVAGFISMWVANTAAMTLLIPILQKMLDMISEYKLKMKETGQEDPRVFKPPESSLTTRQLQVSCYVLLANASCAGGMGTLIGSTSNMAFLGTWELMFPCEDPISFLSWMVYSIPIVVCCLIVLWICALISWEGPIYFAKLMKYFYQSLYYKMKGIDPNKNISGVKEYYEATQNALEKTMPWTFAEYLMCFIFAFIPILLLTRKPELPSFKGWDILWPNHTSDSMVTTFFAILVFLLPRYSYYEAKKKANEDPENYNYIMNSMLKERMFTWSEAVRSVEWGIMWVFGGGFAVARIIIDTGLSSTLSYYLSQVYNTVTEPQAVLISICVSSLLTEFMSNTNVAQILTVILTDAALENCINPLLFTFNSVLASSTGGLFPISTPPHVLAYKAANVTIPQMFRTTLLYKLVALTVLYGLIYAYGYNLMDFSTMPEWARCYTGPFREPERCYT